MSHIEILHQLNSKLSRIELQVTKTYTGVTVHTKQSRELRAMNAIKNCVQDLGLRVSISHQAGGTLYVVNYGYQTPTQMHCQCRSLVLAYEDDSRKFELVSQSFDRFFNYGEYVAEGLNKPDIAPLTFYEKLDGSLVSVFCYKGQWLYRTKSMIMPAEDMVNEQDTCWKTLIEECLWWPQCTETLNESKTYILEVYGSSNLIVTPYEGDSCSLLAVRNLDGTYDDPLMSSRPWWPRPKSMTFRYVEEMKSYIDGLDNLQEGLVGYTPEHMPVVKVKSAEYVAQHNLKGNSLSEKAVILAVISGEYSEYITYFPHTRPRFIHYVKALEGMEVHYKYLVSLFKGYTRKELAQRLTDRTLSPLLINMHKYGNNFEDSLKSQRVNRQIALVKTYAAMEQK